MSIFADTKLRIIMAQSVKQFYAKDGYLAFIIPFSFTTDNKKETNVCKDLFAKIRPEDDREQYEYYNDKLVAIISKAFPNAANAFCGATERDKKGKVVHTCHYGKVKTNCNSYKGRNLCHCFSVCRKFHDDQSQGIPRLEIYLGTYRVRYEISQKEEKFFEFDIDALLLLTNATGGEGGYLLFNISLASVQKAGIESLEENDLDSFIFIKHLFYKSRLKCTINGEQNISIYEWAGAIFKDLMYVLEIKDGGDVAFRYTIMELNNLVDSPDSSENPIIFEPIGRFLMDYRRQVYGLLTSDEGWRYVSNGELRQAFKDNHWSSRRYTTAFFLGHNALIINQYDGEEYKRELPEKELSKETQSNGGKKLGDKTEAYNEFSKTWFKPYTESPESGFYEEYAQLRPCVPGVQSLVLNAYLKAIYKEMVLAKVKEMYEGNSFTDEEKYNRLAFALQQHSMSLDVIKNIEDCIYSQFGIPAELHALRESYMREANNVQNQKIMNLTYITAIISISALIIAVLALGVEGGNSLFAAGMDWTIGILVVALAAPIITCIVVQKNLLDKRKKKRQC